jgi:hypothetical protein
MTAYTWDGSFPSSPSEGDTLIINGTRHEYTSKGSWRKTEFVGQGTIETLAATLGKGNTVYTDGKINFRDAALHISSSTDGQLDIVADTEIQIAAPTVDINGAVALDGAITGATNVTLSGNITVGGTVDGRDVAADGTKLDTIEASADVTDTTNVVAALTAGTGITIDSDGTIAAGPLAVTTVQTAVSQVAHLALTAQEGDVVIRSDENKSYMHNGGTAGTMADYTLLATPTDAVLSVNGVTGAVTAANIATAVEAAAGSNTFTDADHTKLNAIEASADVTDATNVTAAGAAMLSGATFTGNVAITKAGDITTSVFDTTTGVAGSTRTLAEHYVQGKSNSGATVNFQNITYNSADATNGSEDGSQIHYQMLAGTSTAWLNVDGITPTFAGDIALSPADNTPTLNFRHNSNADTYASIIVDTDAGTGGKMVIGTKRNGNTLLTALTIDDDQNATFAGDVNIGGKISNTWTTFTSKLDAEAYSIASIDGTQVDFAQNYYYDGAYKTVVTGYASYIRQAAGVITFRNSTASVTADDAITWAESLSLAAGTGNATFGGKTCFDGTLYSDLYAAGSTIQLGNQFFVSEVAANRADMLLGMTLNAASDFESTGTIKPSGIVLQDGSIILAVDGTTRTVGSAAAATARLTITDTSATFANTLQVIGGISTNGGSGTIQQGLGSPEGAITAIVGSIFMQLNGGAGSTLYVKESGTGNTGWSSVS